MKSEATIKNEIRFIVKNGTVAVVANGPDEQEARDTLIQYACLMAMGRYIGDLGLRPDIYYSVLAQDVEKVLPDLDPYSKVALRIYLSAHESLHERTGGKINGTLVLRFIVDGKEEKMEVYAEGDLKEPIAACDTMALAVEEIRKQNGEDPQEFWRMLAAALRVKYQDQSGD